MIQVRTALFLALPLTLPAADPVLLQLMMPDAQVLAGLQVNQAKNSQFGQYVLSHMQLDSPGFQKFAAETGFDPRSDLGEIVMGSNSTGASSGKDWLIAAHGTFNIAKITSAVQANGGTATTYQGVNLVTFPESSNSQGAIAFFDASTAAMGDLDSVKGAISRQKSSAPTGGIFATAQNASSTNDFWFVTLVPLSQFSSVIPNPGGASNNNFLAGISQASGGINFGDPVTISTQAVARSDKDAQALVNVVQFFVSLVQMNRQQNPEAGQVASILDSLQTSINGNVATISLSIPEQQLEQLLQMTQQSRQAHAKPAPQIH